MGEAAVNEATPTEQTAPRRLPILSVSRANRYRACPRSDYFASVVRRVPRRVVDDRRFGTLFHVGLDPWWRALALDPSFLGRSPLEAAIDAVRAAPNSDPYEVAKAEVLLTGYDARWANEGLVVVWLDGEPAVEVDFEGDLRNPQSTGISRTFRRGGKIDAIVRAPNGDVYVMEHKTSSEDIGPGSVYYQRLTLDPQCSMYMNGARDLGLQPAGVIYDVIGKPGLKPLKATPVEQRKYTKATAKEPSRLYSNQREYDETPAEYGARIALAIAEEPHAYYQRAYVVRSAEEEREAAWDLWQTALQIRESAANDVWPRNPKSCEQYRRLCDYFGVCTGQQRIDDDFHFRTKEAS
jgi:hypothetical protein